VPEGWNDIARERRDPAETQTADAESIHREDHTSLGGVRFDDIAVN
jgi:hypothetical protein